MRSYLHEENSLYHMQLTGDFYITQSGLYPVLWSKAITPPLFFAHVLYFIHDSEVFTIKIPSTHLTGLLGEISEIIANISSISYQIPKQFNP